MTTDCTRCGAATAAHMLTTINKRRRADQGGVRAAVLCPACYDAWWAAETGAALSLVAHPGRRAPKRRAS